MDFLFDAARAVQAPGSGTLMTSESVPSQSKGTRREHSDLHSRKLCATLPVTVKSRLCHAASLGVLLMVAPLSTVPGQARVHWVEGAPAPIQRITPDDIAEQAGPAGHCVIVLPPGWRAVVEVEIWHRQWKSPAKGAPMEVVNDGENDALVPFEFESWMHFRDGAAFLNRRTVRLGEQTQNHDLPATLFRGAHTEEVFRTRQRADEFGRRVLLVECRKIQRHVSEPYFRFQIYLTFLPPPGPMA